MQEVKNIVNVRAAVFREVSTSSEFEKIYERVEYFSLIRKEIIPATLIGNANYIATGVIQYRMFRITTETRLK